jgi:hypothetical protein
MSLRAAPDHELNPAPRRLFAQHAPRIGEPFISDRFAVDHRYDIGHEYTRNGPSEPAVADQTDGTSNHPFMTVTARPPI